MELFIERTQKIGCVVTQIRAWFPEGQNNGQLGVLGAKKVNYESLVAVLV